MRREYKHLLDPSKYQVFLFTSNSVIPFSFIKHPWFVVNNKGDISRWEITLVKAAQKKFVTKDYSPPFIGSDIFHMGKNLSWKAELRGYATGDEYSYVKQMVDMILQSSTNYPFKNIYKYLGPNSNTYAQWILESFPEFKPDLPWNSLGKGYKVKRSNKITS